METIRVQLGGSLWCSFSIGGPDTRWKSGHEVISTRGNSRHSGMGEACTRQLNRGGSDIRRKKKGGKKEEGEETRKKNEERNCWTPRERINFTRCGQRKTSGSLKSYLSPFDRSTRSQSFERIVSPISHPFNLSRLRTNVGRNAFNFIHWKSLLVEEKNTKIALRTWNDFEFESHLDRSRRRERSDTLEAWMDISLNNFVIIQWGKFKRTMRTTVNHEW